VGYVNFQEGMFVFWKKKVDPCALGVSNETFVGRLCHVGGPGDGGLAFEIYPNPGPKLHMFAPPLL